VHVGTAGFTEHHPRIADGVGEYPVVVGNDRNFFTRRLVEMRNVSAAISGLSRSGSEKTDVERDDDGRRAGSEW